MGELINGNPLVALCREVSNGNSLDTLKTLVGHRINTEIQFFGDEIDQRFDHNPQNLISYTLYVYYSNIHRSFTADIAKGCPLFIEQLLIGGANVNFKLHHGTSLFGL